MAASGADFSPDTILPLLQLSMDSRGFPEYKEAEGVGGDDGLLKIESLTWVYRRFCWFLIAYVDVDQSGADLKNLERRKNRP